MRITLPIVTLVAASLVLGGCKKRKRVDDDDDKPATAAPAPPPPAPAPPPKPTANPNEVARYQDEVPIGGATVELLRDFAVHQAADYNSTILTHVGKGVMINVKATHSDWMLIEYPSAPATMSPGWIALRNIYDPRVRVHNGRPPAVPARLPGGRQPTYPPRRR